MATIQEMSQALKNAHAAGDTEAATRLAQAIDRARRQTQPLTGIDYVAGLADTAAQGLTLGFGDEIAAATQAALGRTPEGGFFDYGGDYGSRYEQNLARERQVQQQFARENPKTAFAAEVAGAAIPLVATGAGTGSVRAAARLGGAEGAVYGFGSGEGGLAERAQSAAIGAPVGAAGGAVAQKFIGPAIVSTAKAVRRGLQEVFNSDAQTARGVRKLLRTADEAGLEPQELLERVSGGEVIGQQDPLLMDLARTVQTQSPGKPRKTIKDALQEGFAANQERVMQETKRLLGGEDNYYRWRDDFATKRGKAAAPIYRKAYEEGDREIWTPTLERLAGIKEVKDAMQTAVNRWGLAANADGYGAVNPRAVVEGGQVKFNRAGGIPAYPNLQFWDYTKRALDSAVGRAIREGDNDLARGLTIAAKGLREELDRVGPKAYRKARQKYAGASRILDAAQVGENLLNMPAELAEVTIEGMTGPELQAVRNATAARVRDMVERGQINRDVIKRIYGTQRNRKILSDLFGDTAQARDFFREMEKLSDFNQLRSTVFGGSRTQQYLSDAADINAGGMIEAAISAAGGNLAPAVREAAVRTLGSSIKALRGMPEEGLQAMADLLVTDNPEVVERLFRAAGAGDRNAISQLERRVNRALRQFPGAFGGVVGGGAGQQLTTGSAP